MREQPGISEEHLRTCLQEQYDLFPVTLEFLPRGHDYSAGVYRVVSERGTAYLLKATSRALYEPAYFVPAFLKNQGISSVVAPVPTKSHALWTKLADWIVIVYPWIPGDSSLTGITDEHWKEVGCIFRQIHQVRQWPEGFESLRKETFDPLVYTQWISSFEAHHLKPRAGGSDSARAFRASWSAHQSTIDTAVDSLEKLAKVLQSRTFPYVICHADLHASNLIRDRAGRVFVIDWDEVMLAPKERDFIFIRGPQAGAFWEGYAQREIDWTILSYYLWERVVQDMIEEAKNVCFRDDLSEETRMNIARSFHASLSEEGSNLAAAYAAAAHLTV